MKGLSENKNRILFENRYAAGRADVRLHYACQMWKDWLAVDLFFGFLLLAAFLRGGSPWSIALAVLLLLLLNLLLMNGYRLVWRRISRHRERSGGAAETVIRFTEEGIFFEEGGLELKVSYDQVRGVKVFREQYVLTTGRKAKARAGKSGENGEGEASIGLTCILLRRDAFSTGEEEAFPVFLTSVCPRLRQRRFRHRKFRGPRSSGRLLLLLAAAGLCSAGLLFFFHTPGPEDSAGSRGVFQEFLEGEGAAADVTADGAELNWEDYLARYSGCSPEEVVVDAIELDLSGDGRDELILSVTRTDAEWIQDVYVFHDEDGALCGWEVMSFPSDRWETSLLSNGLLRDSYWHEDEQEVNYYQYDPKTGVCALAASFTGGEEAESGFEAPVALWIYKMS